MRARSCREDHEVGPLRPVRPVRPAAGGLGLALAVAAAVAACGGGGASADAAGGAPDAPGAADAAPAPDADCRGCSAAPGLCCSAEQVCLDDLCCRPAVPTGAFDLPAHAGWVEWRFAGTEITRIEFPFEIENDPGASVGLYFAPFNGQIDRTMFYLGLQTDVAQPGVGGIGKGILFSRWDTLDPADLRVAPGGFSEIGTHEGEFVGVRLPVEWTTGAYRMILARAEADGEADWFEMSLVDPSGTTIPAGGLRFPRRSAGVPARINQSGTAFVEIYSHATDYGEVPAWRLGVMALADGELASYANSDYPAWPTAEFPNVDIFYDAPADRVRLRYGGATARCHPPGRLFTR